MSDDAYVACDCVESVRMAFAHSGMSSGSDQAPVQVVPSSSWPRFLPWAVAAIAVGLAAFVLRGASSTTTEVAPVRRLELTLPAGVELFTSNRTVAVSPDGSRVAFVGVRAGTRQVYLRSLDQFEAIALKGSDSATVCFFAPDGRSIGIVTNTGVIRTVSLADGLVTTVTDGANFLYGAAWGEDDRIVFVRGGTLWQIARSGGSATQLTKLGGPRGDTLHANPAFLPGSKTLLFAASSGDQRRIEALVVASGERRTVRGGHCRSDRRAAACRT